MHAGLAGGGAQNYNTDAMGRNQQDMVSARLSLYRTAGETGDDLALRQQKKRHRRDQGQGDEGQHQIPIH